MGSSINWTRRRTGALGPPEEVEYVTPSRVQSLGKSPSVPRVQGHVWTPPAEFDSYRLGDRLGMGGMGQVFLAQDIVLDRLVAIKFIQTLKSNPEHRERFLVEARAIARLQHPNVVTIYRVGEADGQPYLVSEFVRGQSLDLISTPLPWEAVLKIGIGLARGLAAAHRHGVVHRDLKPGNAILADDGEVKILDFGLAKLIGDSASATSLPSEGARRKVQGPTALGEPGARGADALPCLVDLSLTDPEALIGTPHYIPPEVWMGDPGSYRSDVYSLGLILFKLVTGRLPFEQQNIDLLKAAILAQTIPALASVAAVNERFAEVVDRCLRRDLELRYASGEELREALERLSSDQRPVSRAEGNPYRGLRPFDAEHRALFFGRESDCRAILERLRTDSLVVMAGDSGVGKSSLCRAAVIPGVLEGALGSDRAWQAVTVIPGRRPLVSFAASLAPLLKLEEESVTALLREGFGTAARQIRKQLKAQSGLVIFIDQMEELVTTSDPDEAHALARLLAELCIFTPGIRLIGSARGDFLTRIAALPALGPEIGRALYLVQPLSAEKIREAVTGPARATGVSFESEPLIDGLVNSTLNGSGSLPLLQFALAELWERRDVKRTLITGKALDAMGGVTGALATHADNVVAGLLPEQRQAARRMLVQLVTLEGTRAHRTEEELTTGAAAAREALEALVRGRLLVARDTPVGSVLEVSHEALIGGWPTLRTWLAEDKELRAARERLGAAVRDWERLGGGSGALWSARQIAEIDRFKIPDLSARASDFLRLSRRSNRRQRLFLAGVGAALFLALATTLLATRLKARREINHRVQGFITSARSSLAQAREDSSQVAALSQAAFGLFDHQTRTRAESVWADALRAQTNLDATYAETTNALDAALMLEGENADARRLLADVLLERAILADTEHRAAARDELLGRLAVYDVGGHRLQRFNGPGLLSLSSAGEKGVTVRAERIVVSGRSRNLQQMGELGITPGNYTLPNGCYVLTLEATGRATARLPVCLQRDEEVAVEVPLLKAGAVPAGFAYVPPGDFLFGASDEKQRTEILDTVPLHRVHTDGFLIQKTETTYGQWLEFLNALTPKEQKRFLSHPANSMQGGENYSLLPLGEGRWQLTLQPTTQVYQAKTGERLVIPGRTRRSSQNWLQLPVAGITWKEAQAFLEWARASGRIPNARFCTETEWERAARGADDREYPHGDALAPDDANFDETYAKQASGFGPDEVGSHPLSRSVFGVDDMAGNVWEWTTSHFAAREFVLRGGAWYYGRRSSLVTNREVVEPGVRDTRVGLRVCASVPGQARSPDSNTSR